MPDMEIIQQLANDVGADTALMLMGIFKDDADTRMAFVRTYSETGGDVKELRVQAHSLKGLCRTYGAARAGDAAMDLQDACDGGDETLIAEKLRTVLDIIPDDVEAAIAAMTTLAGENAGA